VDYSQFIRDEAGVAVRLIGGLRDITWRKEAEEALRESEERFRQVAETSREWIWEFDAEGRYTYCNPGVKDIFGYAPEELIGKPYWHLLTPEDRDRLRPVAVDILARRDSFFRLVNANVHKDGHTVVIESTGRPIFDAEGALVGYRGVDQDITARKLAEQALRESEERFRELAESIRDVFFAMDKDLKYTYWNKASEDLTGISAEDAIGKSLYEVFPDVKGTRAEEVYLEVLRTQEPRTFVTEYRLGGKDFFFEISVYPSRAGLSVFVKDVSARKRAEEALRRREQEISVLADNVPTLFSYVDSDGCYRFANQRYEEWFGVPRTAIVGRHLTQVLGEATYERIRDHVERVLLGEHVHFEDVLPYKIAGTRWVSADYVPDTNDRGEVKGFFALIVDMTERKRAEEALRESERRYRLLAENARDVIWTVDMNLRTTYVSPSVTHLWGYSVEEIMTRTVDQMLTPASLDVAMEALAEELAAESTGQIDPSRSRTLELESVCRDGSTIWTEAKMSALRDERGRLVGILGVSRDITERKRAQTILKASERRYRLLAENASDIIWIRDLDLRAMYVNPAVTRIRGYSVEEVMAQTPEEILTPASLEFAREVLAEEVAKDQVEERDLFWWRTLELENICKDGSTVWLEERVTALRDDDKRIVGILGISRDISERKRAEEALQKAREELETRVEHRMRRGSAHGLTFRELTVLHLVAAGESNKEIAATLGISTLTASKHLANILHKMGAASRTEAGVRAVKEGLLD
jgi:PAS domain S-box-containing protein